MTDARRGFFPFVAGDAVTMKQAGAMAIGAKGDLRLSQGGGQVMGAGNNMSIRQGGGWVIGAGNKISVEQGGGWLMGARNISVKQSYVGMALGREVTIDEDATVVFGSSRSFLVGVLAGLLASLAVAAFRSD